MIKLYEHSIVDTCTACPYCMSELPETWLPCCGEMGHGETAYLLTNGDLVLASEVKRIIPNDIRKI